MKDLSTYIIESGITPLSEYMLIDEGKIFRVFKKFFKWAYRSIKKNLKAHDGVYTLDDDIVNANEDQMKYLFPKISQQQFDEMMKLMNTDIFDGANKYRKKYPDHTIFVVVVEYENGGGTQIVGFIFTKDKEVKAMLLAKQFFANKARPKFDAAVKRKFG